MDTPVQLFSPVWPRSGQNCRSPLLSFSWWRWKDGRVKRPSWSRDRGRGPSRSRSCSHCASIHYHSLTVCHLPLFCHSLSLFLPPTFSFHPRPTSLAVVGVAIRHGAECEKHKAKLGQILHAAQITLEDCTLLSSPLRCPNLLCVSVGTLWAHTSAQIACFSF